MKIPEDLARLGARWWADYLRSDQIPSLVKEAGYGLYPKDLKMTPELQRSQQRERMNGEMGDFLIRGILARSERLKEEEVDAFEEQLAIGIMNASEDLMMVSIHVDYHPDRMLTDALIRAGIDRKKTNADSRFPFKTVMHLDEESVGVSAGYGAPREDLFTSKRLVIRKMLVEREYKHLEPLYDMERKAVDPLCDARSAISKKYPNQYYHPEYLEAHRKVLEAMEPTQMHRTYFRNARDGLINALPLMPGGKLETIVDELWAKLLEMEKTIIEARDLMIRLEPPAS